MKYFYIEEFQKSNNLFLWLANQRDSLQKETIWNLEGSPN